MEDDTIALTSQATGKGTVYSVSEDPWSPTVTFGQANVQRVVSIQGGAPRVSRVR